MEKLITVDFPCPCWPKQQMFEVMFFNSCSHSRMTSWKRGKERTLAKFCTTSSQAKEWGEGEEGEEEEEEEGRGTDMAIASSKQRKLHESKRPFLGSISFLIQYQSSN